MQGIRKPTVLKILDGEKNKDRINPSEPKPRPIMPRCPEEFDDDARAVWNRMGPILWRNGLLTEADGDAFGVLCSLEAAHIRLRRAMKEYAAEMKKEAEKAIDAGETPPRQEANPFLGQEMRIIAQKRPYYNDFGMNPASRTKISVPGWGLEDGFEGLLD